MFILTGRSSHETLPVVTISKAEATEKAREAKYRRCSVLMVIECRLYSIISEVQYVKEGRKE